MGCLSVPFKLLGVAGLIVALAIGWLYRDRLAGELQRVLNFSKSGETATATGRPGSQALASARSKVDSLNGWSADSVVLTASEVASLIGAGLDPSIRRQLDSLQVELLDGSVAVNAKLATARLPRELTGPLTVALREREPVRAAGPIRVARPGRAEWAINSFQIREFPIPRDAVPKLVAKAFGDTARRTI
ncbi:MAG TPA: hypothetical protein VGP44_10320, partial [Gemmatimonadales bacterium]|nr:hypothetical protein [Gemmatimonadales bacterium]